MRAITTRNGQGLITVEVEGTSDEALAREAFAVEIRGSFRDNAPIVTTFTRDEKPYVLFTETRVGPAITPPKRKTYRVRNTKNRSVSPTLIHTFWVGQVVVRSWERKNYTDLIGEVGRVTALPTSKSSDSDSLAIALEDGTTTSWSATECLPIRALMENNRARFASRAKDFAEHLKTLDENGAKK